MWGSDLEKSKEFYLERPSMWAKERPAYAEYAALALAAADAVVTVEMIAEVARASFNRWWNAEIPDFGEYVAKEILALLRGGEGSE
jgi:hypothetical protein